MKLKANGTRWDRRDYYYSADWQVVEERELLSTTSKTTVATVPKYPWVWGTGYIDEVVLRDENKDGDGDCVDGTDQRLYYCQDANFNVTALVDTAGTVVERVLYDAYGRHQLWNGSWSATQASTVYGNEVLYAGYRHDPESGLYQVRFRHYHPTLGRFTQMDPIVGNRPLKHYAYGANNPLSHIDPLGLQEIPTLEEAQRQEIEFLERMLKEEVTGFWNTVRSWNPFGGGLDNWAEFQAQLLKLRGREEEFLKRTGGEAGFWMHTITAVSPQQVASRIVAGKDLVTQKEVGANERAMEALLWVATPLALNRMARRAAAAEGGAARVSTAGVAEETAHVGIKGRAGITAGSEATTVLYRAVKRAELDDIVTHGGFRNPAGIERKYFSETLEGAISYAKQSSTAYGDGPFWIVKTTIRKDVITSDMRALVDRGVPTITVPTNKLSGLGPPESLIQAPIKFPQR